MKEEGDSYAQNVGIGEAAIAERAVQKLKQCGEDEDCNGAGKDVIARGRKEKELWNARKKRWCDGVEETCNKRGGDGKKL